ncbi:MAG: replication-associated recombination protein A [Oscillospiraceae bacterium]|nr:replication-associated recombination protein A [Oscillospiraceae bacterium]
MYQPLADRLRPQTLDDVCGQDHILGPGAMLRRIVDSGRIPNLIFYGPSGVGKTTVANIIARTTRRELRRLNATTASSQDIRDIVAQIGTMMAPSGILLYLDEIQYFNKKQQQSLLEHIETGGITLIAATTENPYFYIYNAILSRSTVFEFRPIAPEAALRAVLRAKERLEAESGMVAEAEEGALEHVARACGGDLRKAMNAVELLFAAGEDGGRVWITCADARAVTQKSAMRYDRDGDGHYDILSAFHKSIRGSDPDAALHYLARLLEGGDLSAPCRRLLVIASEDVGLAHPQAIAVVKACVDAALQIGLPEARLPLAEAAVFLATCPKSNSVTTAMEAAMADLKAGRTGDVPAHLKDAHYAGAARLGRGLTYRFPHDFPSHFVPQQYLPDALQGAKYYEYGPNKTEQAAKRYWDAVKG